MPAHGALGETEAPADLPVGEAQLDERRDLALAERQPIGLVAESDAVGSA